MKAARCLVTRATVTAIIVVTLAALALTQAPDPERRITEYIDAHNRDALRLLERVVNINSGTLNLAGVREVGRVFRAEFDTLGFTTKWVDGAAWQRAGHLVADHPGAGPRILLIGHLDTVFEPDSPFQKFQRLDERSARGPGITDMKGGDVIIISALKALEAAGALATMNLVVVMTGDEESTGRPLARAREVLMNAARGADAAIGFEDGPGDPRFAVIARRGSSSWQLRVTGTAAHSSQIFRDNIGPGAVFEAARILNEFREQLSSEAHLTFNPGLLVGGTSADVKGGRGSAAGKNNVIAGQLVAAGDLRALTRDQFERATQTMRAIAAASLPHTQATLTFDEGYPPMAPTDGNARLLAVYDRASRDVGAGPVAASDPDAAGAADVSFVAGQAGMILDGIGLMGKGGHTPDETADLSTLPSQAKRAALTLYRISQGAGRP